MKLFTKLFTLYILLSLQSCSHYAWVSDTRPNSQLDGDLTNCQHWAFKEFPPNVTPRTTTSLAPVKSTSVSTGKYGETRVTEGFVPIKESELVDANVTPREIALKKCMNDNEWRLVKVQ